MALQTEGRYPTDKPAYSVIVGCEVSGPVENRDAALAKFEGAMSPADRGSLEEWVVALHAGTVSRRGDEAGLTVALDLYVNVLARYPADVAKAACMRLLLEGQWFPPVSEIEALCKKLVEPRTAILAGLKAWRAPVETKADRASELRLRAHELERKIPMSYRRETPRSQWTGDYLQWAEEADAAMAEARQIETGRARA